MALSDLNIKDSNRLRKLRLDAKKRHQKRKNVRRFKRKYCYAS